MIIQIGEVPAIVPQTLVHYWTATFLLSTTFRFSYYSSAKLEVLLYLSNNLQRLSFLGTAKMREFLVHLVMLSLASARPQAVATGSNSTGTLLSAVAGLIPQLELTANNAHDLTEGTACRDIYFLMARGSGEWGTLGVTIGPVICRMLREEYKDKIGCDGLGPAYSGGLGDNIRPKGTTDEAIAEGVKIFTLAHSKCPNSLLTFGGYR